MTKPAIELAQLVQSGELGARELVQASLDRIEELDGQVNAFTTVVAEMALAEADKIKPGDERPLAGVPVGLKDLGLMAKDIRLTFCSDLVGDFMPDHDSSVVRRLKDAGCIPVGRTSSPEFGLPPVTEPRRFGPTRNPWNLEHTPGGSSGGTAAAVAAGMVPAGHASDGGGSIRIPAACCGLVGLKPSRGRISKAPDIGEATAGLSTDGVITKTVADTALMLDILEGYEPGDPYWLDSPSQPFAESAESGPERLKIAITTSPPIDVEVHSEHSAAVEKTGELLDSLGHNVDVAAPQWHNPMLRDGFTQLWCVFASQAVFFAEILSGGKKASPENIEPLSWELKQKGDDAKALDFLTIQFGLHAFSRQVVSFWDEYDVLVTPASAKRPLKIGELDTCGPEPMEELKKAGDFVPFTPVFNVTGQPAISLPLFQSDDGMPIGIQFVGPPAGDALLLQLATELEQAQPWQDRRPELA